MEVVGVLSDSHGWSGNIEQALQTCRDYGVGRIIHCGDVQKVQTVELFRGFELDVVQGNYDLAVLAELKEAVEAIGGRFHGLSGELEFAGRRIFFAHGDDEKLISDAIDSQEYDVVCRGHKHQHWERRKGRTLHLQPGAIRENEFCILRSDLEPIFFCSEFAGYC